MNGPCKRLVCCLLFVLMAVPVIQAQEAEERPLTAAEQDAAKADDDLRAGLAETLVSQRETPGREFAESHREMLIDTLRQESAAQLEERLAIGSIKPMLIGGTTSDLTYTTFQQPCRIIDTRISGAKLGGVATNFKVAGTAGFEAQGGTAGGCGVPVGATVAMINFVAVSPSGAGNLKGSAYPQPIPTLGSIINYQAVAGLNIANGLLFPICDPSVDTCVSDITLEAQVSSTHVVADVLGYAQRAVTTRYIRETETLPATDLDVVPLQVVCQTTPHTPTTNQMARIDSWLAFAGTSFTYVVRNVYTTNGGTTWSPIAGPFEAWSPRVTVGSSGWTATTAWNTGNNSALLALVPGTTYIFGLQIERAPGSTTTGDPTQGRCEVLFQRTSP